MKGFFYGGNSWRNFNMKPANILFKPPNKPLLGSFTQAFFGGQSPWQYEVLYVNQTKMVVKAQGLALSREMIDFDSEG